MSLGFIPSLCLQNAQALNTRTHSSTELCRFCARFRPAFQQFAFTANGLLVGGPSSRPRLLEQE